MRSHGTPSVFCICIQCGSECHVSPSARARGEGRFCSLACWYAYRRQYTRDHWWERVDKSGACWLWLGSVTKFGHGKIAAGGKNRGWTQTHHVAWEEAGGASPVGNQRVLHTCDVPACVRNDDTGIYVVRKIEYPRHGHLYLAPEGINHVDCWDKGRSPFNPGWRKGIYMPL